MVIGTGNQVHPQPDKEEMGGAVMLAWLMKNFVQEVPERLSVCEFDCPNRECTINDWVSCERRQQARLQGSGVTPFPLPVMVVEPKVFSPSRLLKSFPG
jgi:hypothetical protein